MRFDLRLLEPLVALADELEIGPAADRAGISTASLLKRIARFEAQLGVSLFERSDPGLRLTPTGEAIAREARVALTHARALQREASQEQVLRLAAVGGELGMPPGFLPGLAEVVAPVMIELKTLSSAEQLSAVRDGTLDLAWTHLVEPPRGLWYELVFLEPVVLAVGPQAHVQQEIPIGVGRLRSGLTAWESFLDALAADGLVSFTDVGTVATTGETMPVSALSLVPANTSLLTVESGAPHYAAYGMPVIPLEPFTPLYAWALVSRHTASGPIVLARELARRLADQRGWLRPPATLPGEIWLPPHDPFIDEIDRLAIGDLHADELAES